MATKTAKKNNKRTKAKKSKPAARKIKAALPNDPYLHCIAAPNDTPNTSLGYPDGDAQPSVVLEYRKLYTIKPDANGDLVFLLAPSAQGAINMVAGLISTNGITVNNLTQTGFATLTTNAGVGQIPDDMLASWDNCVGPTVRNGGPPAFRPLNCSLDVHYTGSSMMNNGRVSVTRLRCAEEEAGSTTVDASTDYLCDVTTYASVPVSTFLLPSSVVMPARQSFNVRSVPVRPLYEPTIESVTDVTGSVSLTSKFRNSNTSGFQLAPSYHPQCPWYKIEYSGLDQSASITLSLKYCIQYAITPQSNVAPFAHPSPVASPSVLERAARFVSSLPVARPIVNTVLSVGLDLLTAAGNRSRGPMALMNH